MKNGLNSVIVAVIVITVILLAVDGDQRRNEFEKCKTDFLENMPNISEDGSTVVYESVNWYDTDGFNVTLIAFIGNITNIETENDYRFFGAGEKEDTISFFDGTVIKVYYADGYPWYKNKIHRVIVKKYEGSRFRYIQSIEVIE